MLLGSEIAGAAGQLVLEVMRHAIRPAVALELASMLFLASGSILDSSGWKEAAKAREACTSVIQLMVSLEEKCQATSQFELMAAYSSWYVLDQLASPGFTKYTWLEKLAQSGPGQAMKQKALEAVAGATRASMHEACGHQCEGFDYGHFFMSYATCYAHSLCTAGSAGFLPIGADECAEMLLPYLQSQMSMLAETYCLKEPGQDFYCQEQRARLHLDSPSCYSDFTLVDAGIRPASSRPPTCYSSQECVHLWESEQQQHPHCTGKIAEVAEEVARNAPGADEVDKVLTFQDRCARSSRSRFLAV